jgi:predicted phosphoribosyltransferase
MIAAARFCRKRDPAELVVAVPVTPRSSAELVRSEVDRLVCLHVADTPGFAVASFYREFPDLTDDEVQACLSQAAQERVG